MFCVAMSILQLSSLLSEPLRFVQYDTPSLYFVPEKSSKIALALNSMVSCGERYLCPRARLTSPLLSSRYDTLLAGSLLVVD